MLIFNEFPDFARLNQTLALKWLGRVQSTPASEPCTFALAGGTTPGPLYREFDLLFAQASPRRIQLVATDERWVLDDDAQSNERLFRRSFATSAGLWDLVSLKNSQAHPADAIADINARLAHCCNHPFAAVILGMGADGHIASLFPDAGDLLREDPSTACVAACHPQSQQARMSLSLSRLLSTRSIWLVISGAEKRQVLEHAAPSTPIGALLNKAHCDVEVYWCP